MLVLHLSQVVMPKQNFQTFIIEVLGLQTKGKEYRSLVHVASSRFNWFAEVVEERLVCP